MEQLTTLTTGVAMLGAGKTADRLDREGWNPEAYLEKYSQVRAAYVEATRWELLGEGPPEAIRQRRAGGLHL